MAQNEIAAAARAICEEKGISLEAVVEAIESALAAAYRKDFGQKNQNIKVDFDLETAKSKVYDEKTVVEDMPEEELGDGEDLESGDEEKAEEKKVEVKKQKVRITKSEVPARNATLYLHSVAGGRSAKSKKEDKDEKKEEKKEEELFPAEAAEDEEGRRFNPRTEIQLTDAKKLKKGAKVGDVIRTDLEAPAEYGRMAAQTAKQVIIQRIREVERVNLFDEFKQKEHEVVTGVVQRREGRIVLIDLGRTAGILTAEGQTPGEHYDPGQRVKVYVEGVNTGAKGPEIILSRTSPEIVRKIFMLEIPEISNGLVEIKSVAREAGSRTKIAVNAVEESVDPIGSCVGQRGARIQTIIGELNGEKVDIIEYDEDQAKFIGNSLAPAKIIKIELNEEKKIATATVASDQLSLAIGKGGQNVRLAAKLTGWKIDVKEAKGSAKSDRARPADAVGRAGAGSANSEEMEDKEDKVETKEIKKLTEAKDKKEKEDVKEDEKSEAKNAKDKGGEKKKIKETKETINNE